MPSAGHQCTFCQRKFSSRNHLKRHEASSHSSQTHVNCEFCGRKYSRRDALRRHYKGCTRVSTLPEPNRAGRRKTACDACALTRSTCDGSLPCLSCERQGASCTYQRLHDQGNDPPTSLPEIQIQDVSSESQRMRTAASLRSGQLSVPFLLNYSAPSNRTPGDVNQALSLLSTTEPDDQPVPVNDGLPSLEMEANGGDLFLDDSWAFFFGPVPDQRSSRSSSLFEGLDNLEEKQLATEKMIDCLSKVNSASPRNDYVFDQDREQAFFNQENVGEFIEAYFDRTVRPRSRIVLKSSFNLGSTSTPLLLPLFLLGAICSTCEQAKFQAVTYVDLAETAVFESPTFLHLVYNQNNTDSSTFTKNDIEIIQAAILVILIQLASPKQEARRRVRIQRYPALVSIARATSLTKIRNTWHDSSRPLNHEAFLRNETCIRLMASITMLDCHNIMFFNCPPQFTPSEFCFDLPAEEKGIDIRDSATWEVWAENERKHDRPPPLNEFIQELLSDTWKGTEDPRMNNLNIFATFIVVSAFQPIIFNIRSSFCDVSNAKTQIDRALSRWMSLWDHLKSKWSQQEIYRAGITYHAPDLCVFDKLMLQKPLSETGEVAKDSMTQIHQLLKGRSQ